MIVKCIPIVLAFHLCFCGIENKIKAKARWVFSWVKKSTVLKRLAKTNDDI